MKVRTGENWPGPNTSPASRYLTQSVRVSWTPFFAALAAGGAVMALCYQSGGIKSALDHWALTSLDMLLTWWIFAGPARRRGE